MTTKWASKGEVRRREEGGIEEEGGRREWRIWTKWTKRLRSGQDVCSDLKLEEESFLGTRPAAVDK